MRFFIRKRRQTPTVIIVALIDVLIVLLIFLIVTTTFKQQSPLRLALPESSQAKKAGADEHAPFVVSINTNGMYFLGAEKLPVTFESLKGQLISQAAANSQMVVAINADENAPWGKVVKVRAAAADAGIKTIVAYTREPGKP